MKWSALLGQAIRAPLHRGHCDTQAHRMQRHSHCSVAAPVVICQGSSNIKSNEGRTSNKMMVAKPARCGAAGCPSLLARRCQRQSTASTAIVSVVQHNSCALQLGYVVRTYLPSANVSGMYSPWRVMGRNDQVSTGHCSSPMANRPLSTGAVVCSSSAGGLPDRHCT